jgi:hypothetical protein
VAEICVELALADLEASLEEADLRGRCPCFKKVKARTVAGRKVGARRDNSAIFHHMRELQRMCLDRIRCNERIKEEEGSP